MGLAEKVRPVTSIAEKDLQSLKGFSIGVDGKGFIWSGFLMSRFDFCSRAVIEVVAASESRQRSEIRARFDPFILFLFI